jgi:hypothetical protein
MSIDPAIDSSQTLKNALPFDSLSISPDNVYIYDFDGVISSRFEDDIYRLAPADDEIDLLEAAARKFGIRCEGMEQRYQRHLLYQAAAWSLKLPIEPGPGFERAKQANDFSHLFVLTARSGWYAAQRMRDFLRERSIFPIEIYNVGRVKKDRQIELVCREYPTKMVYFVEDSAAHLTNVAALNLSNLALVLLENRLDLQPKSVSLKEHFREVLKAALK